MAGQSRRGSLVGRVLPFAVSFALLAWAAFGPDLFHPPLPPLRIALYGWAGYAPFFHAAELGLIDPARIHLERLSSAPAAGIGMDADAIDGVALTLDEVLRLHEERRDLRIVLVVDESAGADAILAREGIPDVASLRGRRVAIEPDSVSEYLLARALEINGASLADVVTVPVAVDLQARRWREGDIDAAATFEPSLGSIRDTGAKVLFDSRQVPGEIVDVLVMKADVVASRPEDVRHLLRAWFRVLELDRSPGSSTEAALARISGQSVADTRRSLSGMIFPDSAQVRAMLLGPSPQLLSKAERLEGWLSARHMVSDELPVASLFGPDVDALHAGQP